MKNIEKIVPSLETCKQMQDMGIDFGETVFVWSEVFKFNRPGIKFWLGNTETAPNKVLIEKKLDYDLMIRSYKPENLNFIPAPTTDEIIDRLPAIVRKKDMYDYNLTILKKQNGVLIADYYDNLPLADLPKENRLVQSVANLCIWCKKEGYL
jgi:hypothetical protein